MADKTTLPPAKLHRFAVTACGETFAVWAEDYMVDEDGAQFFDYAGNPNNKPHTFVSHPCIVQQERPGVPSPFDDDSAAAAAASQERN